MSSDEIKKPAIAKRPRPKFPTLIVRRNFESFVSKRDLGLYAFQSYEAFKNLGFKPRKDLKSWPIAKPVDWSSDPFEDRNWKFQLNGWRCLDPILNEYFSTGQNCYIEEAIQLAVDWWQFYKKNKRTEFVWHDMATGLRAFRLALFLDRIFSKQIDLPEPIVASLLDCAGEHIGRLRDERFIRDGNHGVFQVFGLHLLAKVALGPVGYATCRSFCQSMFARIMEAGYTDEGVHKEHSPSYHLFTTARIKSFQPKSLADGNTLNLLRRAETITPWLVQPDGRIVPIGDSADDAKPLQGPVALTRLKSGRAFAVADLTSSGYAIIRSNPVKPKQPSMLMMTGMWYSEMHKHSDELSFTLFEHGEPVLIDAGKYGYQYDHLREYVVSASAHNTVGFRDPTASVGKPVSKGSFLHGIELEQDGFSISGAVERLDCFTHSRRIIYSPEKYLHIVDNVQGPNIQDYASNLHFPHHLEPKLLSNGFEVRLTCGKVIRGIVEGDGAFLEIARGETDPMLGWESVGYLTLKPASTIRAVFSGANRSVIWKIDLT